MTADAAAVLTALEAAGASLAVAESLTGGLLGATFTAVPGASRVFRGGVTAYATDLKADLLGVPADLLSERGAVCAEVAVAMADGVRRRLGATYGVGLTGVAGPDPQDGRPAGTVHVAVSGPAGDRVVELSESGDRAAVRAAAVRAAVGLLWEVVGAAVG